MSRMVFIPQANKLLSYENQNFVLKSKSLVQSVIFSSNLGMLLCIFVKEVQQFSFTLL